MQNATTQTFRNHLQGLKVALTTSRTREWENVGECAGFHAALTASHSQEQLFQTDALISPTAKMLPDPQVLSTPAVSGMLSIPYCALITRFTKRQPMAVS